MKMDGEYLIPTNVKTVWYNLNDPLVLKEAIPGCVELIKDEENKFNALIALKVGPVSAKFKGEVRLSDIKMFKGYKISGNGNGGVAGFAKGSADIHLEEKEDGTILRYSVNAQIGGKLAQLGSRLIDSTSKKLAGKFFANFVQIVDTKIMLKEKENEKK